MLLFNIWYGIVSDCHAKIGPGKIDSAGSLLAAKIDPVGSILAAVSAKSDPGTKFS